MQISPESYINVLTEKVKNLTIENAQLRAFIFDMDAKTKDTGNETAEKDKDTD